MHTSKCMRFLILLHVVRIVKNVSFHLQLSLYNDPCKGLPQLYVYNTHFALDFKTRTFHQIFKTFKISSLFYKQEMNIYFFRSRSSARTTGSNLYIWLELTNA